MTLIAVETSQIKSSEGNFDEMKAIDENEEEEDDEEGSKH